MTHCLLLFITSIPSTNVCINEHTYHCKVIRGPIIYVKFSILYSIHASVFLSEETMNQAILFTVCVIVCASASALPPSQSSEDPFIDLIDTIEQASFFASLPDHEQTLTFELLAAAETGNLRSLLDRLGYIQLFTYLDREYVDFI